MSKPSVVIRKALSVALMVTVGSFYSLVTQAALAQATPKLAGFVSARGMVFLNGVAANSGATIFSGGQIKTSPAGAAIISLGKLGQIDLGADSELTLKLEAGVIGGHLSAGRATISAPAGTAVNVTTADGIAVADGKQAAVLTIDVAAGNTRVAAARSEAKVTAGDKVEIVAAGQEVSVGTQTNQKGAPCECLDANGRKTGDGKYNDRGVCECKNRTAGGAAGAGSGVGGLSAGALAALIILGVGGAIGGIIAATQGDEVSGGSTGTLSNFR